DGIRDFHVTGVQTCALPIYEEAPRKQTHTAKRIYDRLVEEKGFTGGESTVRHYVRKMRSKPADAFVPLEYDPGEAMQVDWGEARSEERRVGKECRSGWAP